MIRPDLAAFTLALTVIPSLAPAQVHDWALNGMDPVSYETENAAVPGRADIVTFWRGQSWHFATEDNRTRFEANPRALAGCASWRFPRGGPSRAIRAISW